MHCSEIKRFVVSLLLWVLAFYVRSEVEVLVLQSANIEVALLTYNYVAVLFYDNSDRGLYLKAQWMETARRIEGLHGDSQMAMV